MGIPEDMFDGVPVNTRISKETYYRLLAFELLPAELDRALWLDADRIIKGDVTALYHADFHGKLAVACAEKNVKHNARLGIVGGHRYFNAGMILFNLTEMRKRLSRNDIFACIQDHRHHLDLMDQDILNLLLANEVEYADSSLYNNGAFGFSVLPKEKMRELRDTARIVHYLGAVKPWNWKGANWADGYWWDYEWKRMDRFGACIAYRLKNAPFKAWRLIGEAGFMVLSQLKKIKGRKAD